MANKKLKVGKAAGYDKIAPELLKYMGRTGRMLLLKVIRIAWKTKTVSRECNIAIIIPICKNEDNRLSKPQSMPGKIYMKG
jgi:hypothetical protein